MSLRTAPSTIIVRLPRLILFLAAALVVFTTFATIAADSTAQFLQESGADRVHSEFGFKGQGTIVAVFDRGIDYTHDDFRNEDGSTRILYLLDLSDNSGASDPDNPLPVGTVYTREEIDAALSSGTPLATRDAVGHGTLTAGIATGNGRKSSGQWVGVAPQANLIVVKFTSEGAPAHGSQPAEAAFYASDYLGEALDFVLERAESAGMPVVVTANFGSIQGPSDGTGKMAREVDARFGPGKAGRVFVSGSSDDGGRDNHASGTVGSGETIDLKIHKGNAGNLRVDLWYDESDRFQLEVVTPSASFGPYAAPTIPTGASNHSGTGFVMYQRARDIDFFESTSNKREVLMDISGAVGDYILRITGTSVTDGTFHALMNPSTIFSATENRFESYVVEGYTIWDAASANNAIVPNSYVHSPTWTGSDGGVHNYPGDENGTGSLWTGSGVGPTLDGRTGITVSAPGNVNIGPVAPNSYFASIPSALVQGGNGFYAVLAYVSGANPVLTGTIALMLEADPTLDAAEVSDILVSTARTDSFTGATPNPRWGGGKLDAFAAVDAANMVTAVESLPAPDAFGVSALYPNPARGKVNLAIQNPPSGAEVAASIYDLTGRLAMRRVIQSHGSGPVKTELDVSGLPSGTYFVRVNSGGLSATRAILVTR